MGPYGAQKGRKWVRKGRKQQAFAPGCGSKGNHFSGFYIFGPFWDLKGPKGSLLGPKGGPKRGIPSSVRLCSFPQGFFCSAKKSPLAFLGMIFRIVGPKNAILMVFDKTKKMRDVILSRLTLVSRRHLRRRPSLCQNKFSKNGPLGP